MEKPTLDPEERIVSLLDVKQLYISMKRGLFKWAVIGGALAFVAVGNRTSQYKAVASFKEAAEMNSPTNFIKEMIGGLGSESQPQASSIMKSFQVLRPLVEKMGLQVTECKSEWMIPRGIRHLIESIKAEKGQQLADLDPFVFQHVFYQEEKPLDLRLIFKDQSHFSIYLQNEKQEIGKGTIGQEVVLDEGHVKFTLAKAPKRLKIGMSYRFQVDHWASAASSISGAIKMKSDAENGSIINISINNRDRYLAAQIVNELMAQYQAHLKREYDHIANEQISYLEKKQGEIFGKMKHLFDKYAVYLSKNLEQNGALGIKQESRGLLGTHEEMMAKLLSIDVELSRLSQFEKGGKLLAFADGGEFSKSFNQIYQKIQDFKQERDLIDLSLCQVNEQALESRRDELKEIRGQRMAVEQMAELVACGGEISSFDLNPALCQWAKSVHNPEEREDFTEYLQNFSRLLSMREKMLQERFFYGNEPAAELEGLNLDSAKALFLEYNSKLDAAEANMRYFKKFKDEIQSPDFDLASLSSVLKDPLCQKVISDASSLGLQLKDKKHLSEKEEIRWKDEISLHRKILAAHLDQLYIVEELNGALIREKISALQRISLDCINGQISTLYEQAADAIKEHKQALLLEKSLLEEKVAKIRSILSLVLPEKWKQEKWLGIKTGLVSKGMEKVTEIVETKAITNLLHHVESKPLDMALIPSIPQKPRLYLLTFVGALMLPLLVFSFAFIKQLLKGFPVTLEKLRALRLSVLGEISSFCDGPSVEPLKGLDLEILRQIALFIKGGKVVGLIGGSGPDYSFALGENLARMNIKSIVVRCDFHANFRPVNTPGLLQLCDGELKDLPIRKSKGFDYITAGGYSPYGAEIIQSLKFNELIENLKKKYDLVFLLFRAPLCHTESVAALDLCDKAVVTVGKEQTEELTPFVNWAYHDNGCRLTFITQS
ncbi:MAG: hypothetical protein COT85_05845 [Chlamydiae bacterium CG10_big_fil_rev_8_21_14_0_10_42_34]|nr:MAG: hypothetical protein COT85_05845 [Chlamydiae bacterium CG10_big_fil_rev_8_21_14_0_10_42_34]